MSKSRITKELSERLASQLLKKRLDKIQSLKDQMSKFIYDYIVKNIPEDLWGVFQKYKSDYFHTASYVWVTTSKGYSLGNFSLSKPIICQSKYVRFDEKYSKEFEKIYSLKEKKDREYNDLFEQLSAAIYSLRSYDKIIQAFPDTKETLQNEVSATTELLDINVLKRKLNAED